MSLLSLLSVDPGLLEQVLEAETTIRRAPDRLVALLDFAPLGPERLVLLAAVARLGARVVEGRDLFPGFPDHVDLLFAARAVGAYADLLVVRHPSRGAARAAAAESAAPVVSAGDGTGEDPLFALADLAALSDRLAGLSKKGIALCGDLRRNRRAHSLAAGLLALSARVLLVPARGAEPEGGFFEDLARQGGSHPVRFGAGSMSSLLDMVDSWLLTPDLEHQLSLFSGELPSDERERRIVRHQVKDLDAIWVAATRDEQGEPPRRPAAGDSLPWRERDGRVFVSPARPGEDSEAPGERAPLEVRAIARTLVLALEGGFGQPAFPADAYRGEEGMRCRNPGCIACREPGRVRPGFFLARTDPYLVSCLYCKSLERVEFVASRIQKRYHCPSSPEVRKIHRENTVFFTTREEAEAAGYTAAR